MAQPGIAGAPSRLQKATEEVQKYIDQFKGEAEQKINSSEKYSTYKAIVYRTQVVAAGINYIVTIEVDGGCIEMSICVISEKKVSMSSVTSTAPPDGVTGAPSRLMIATEELQKYVDKFKKEAEQKVNNEKAYSTFKAIMYRTQVVAGINYIVTIEVNGGHYIEMTIYVNLDQEASLTSVKVV